MLTSISLLSLHSMIFPRPKAANSEPDASYSRAGRSGHAITSATRAFSEVARANLCPDSTPVLAGSNQKSPFLPSASPLDTNNDWCCTYSTIYDAKPRLTTLAPHLLPHPLSVNSPPRPTSSLYLRCVTDSTTSQCCAQSKASTTYLCIVRATTIGGQAELSLIAAMTITLFRLSFRTFFQGG
ncbi:hypothetical protein B0H12DRAFT_1156859 [Mycena haematopus]|nr:hypothetical protein B0H12DRAFT_1156859 [Mycena haematopus]